MIFYSHSSRGDNNYYSHLLHPAGTNYLAVYKSGAECKTLILIGELWICKHVGIRVNLYTGVYTAMSGSVRFPLSFDFFPKLHSCLCTPVPFVACQLLKPHVDALISAFN